MAWIVCSCWMYQKGRIKVLFVFVFSGRGKEVSFGLQDTVSVQYRDTTLLTAYTSKKKCRGNSMRNTGNQELKVLFVQGEIYEDKIFKIG